jgi:hypothetical protein
MFERLRRVGRAGFGILGRGMLVAALTAGCGRIDGRGASDVPTAPVATSTARVAPGALVAAAAAVDAASTELLAIPGVRGVGVGLDAQGLPVAVVLLERAGARVPARLGSLAVQTEVVGPLRAFALTGRYRPLPIGVSAGNALECLPGTIGCALDAGGRRYLLSANHVFARQNQASIGEAITQPALPDADPTCTTAPPRTVVARLADFEPVVYDARTPNRFDAAIAELTEGETNCATLAPFYGLPSSDPAAPSPDAAILKVGRTTELTRGRIKAIDVKVKITFPAGTALFVGQILTTKGFGAFGDSGSLIVTDDGAFHPVAIVIGGGSNGTAIASPIGPILERFGATICGR